MESNLELIGQYRKKWQRILLDTTPANRLVSEICIADIYKECGLTPTPKIIWSESPLLGYILFQMLSGAGRDKSIAANLGLPKWAKEWKGLALDAKDMRRLMKFMGQTKKVLHERMADALNNLIKESFKQLTKSEIEECGIFYNEFGASVVLGCRSVLYYKSDGWVWFVANTDIDKSMIFKDGHWSTWQS